MVLRFEMPMVQPGTTGLIVLEKELEPCGFQVGMDTLGMMVRLCTFSPQVSTGIKYTRSVLPRLAGENPIPV